MFDLDAFLAELVASRTDPDPRGAAHEVLARALASPADVTEALAPPAGGLELLHHTPDLTVINIAWAPHMRSMPHDHRMWAVIGIYCGREDNQFFRRTADGLDPTNDKQLETADVCALGTQTIHAVTNPTGRLAGAVHVYGGDFVNQPRSQWGPATWWSGRSAWTRCGSSSSRATRRPASAPEPHVVRSSTTPARTNGGRGSTPNSDLSAAMLDRRPVERADRRCAGEERDLDPADLAVTELEVADPAPVVGRGRDRHRGGGR